MPHLTDEDLVRHFYGDGRLEDEPAVEDHLRSCAECRGLWEETTRSLQAIDAAPVPEPDAGFEARIWAKVLPVLRADIGGRLAEPSSPRRVSVLGWAAAAGLAVTVTGTVLATQAWRPDATPPAGAAAADAGTLAPSGRERVLLTALDDHFQRSEMLLVELMNAPAPEGDEFAFERETADDLVDSSRLYRFAAEQSGQVRLAQMLEDLESVLVEVASSPEQIDPSGLRFLRARIEDDDLLFKVRAVSQQINGRRLAFLNE
jgi:hypothetical protein